MSKKYWQAITKSGKRIKESEGSNWNNIKDDVSQLEFVIENGKNKQLISLPSNCEEYIQAKTASANLTGGNVQIESRYVGFKVSDQKVIIRVDEKTNNISIETG